MTAPQTVLINNRPVSFRRLGRGRRKILFFHGFPGSSVQIDLFASHIAAHDLEVVCVDRPGYNQSRRHQGGQRDQATLAAWCLVKSFGWDHAELISVSGGTPFLFSFLQTHPDFIKAVTVISGLAPVARPEFKALLSPRAWLALQALPRLPGALLQSLFPQKASRRIQFKSPLNLLRYFLPASEEDLKVILNSQTQAALGQALHEAFLQGGRGPKEDAKEYTKAWSLDLGSFTGSVHIWHGMEDRILVPQMAELMSQSLPGSHLHLLPREGHYSLPISHLHEILQVPSSH